MKFKKALAVIIVLCIAVAFIACGRNSITSKLPESDKALGNDSNSQGSTDKKKGSDIKVGLMIAISGLGDKSINDQAYAGLLRAQDDFGVQVKLMEPKDTSQFLDMNQRLAESGYSIIINNSFDMADALAQVADSYPDKLFVILDTVVDKPNIQSAIYATHNGSFLAGAAAAMKSKTGTVGFVGGMKIPTIERFQVGFEEGAKYINPNINIMIKYIGNDNTVWSDTAKGKSLAQDLASNGADVVYHAAGGAGLGVIEGCKEKRIWAIGVNIDQEEVAPDTVLTSMLTRGDIAVYESIKSYIEGSKSSNLLILDLQNDGVGVVMSKHFTDNEKSKINEIKQLIIDGTIMVTDPMGQ